MSFLNAVKSIGKRISRIGSVPCTRCGSATKHWLYYGDRPIAKLSDAKRLKHIPLCEKCMKEFEDWLAGDKAEEAEGSPASPGPPSSLSGV